MIEDAQFRCKEKFNGNSKVSISFENYQKVYPFEDSDRSEDEVDWQDTRDDPYRPGINAFIWWDHGNAKFSNESLYFYLWKALGNLLLGSDIFSDNIEFRNLVFAIFIYLSLAKPVPTPKKGFIGKGKDITTKHDEVVCGRKNTARMEHVSYRKYYLWKFY